MAASRAPGAGAVGAGQGIAGVAGRSARTGSTTVSNSARERGQRRRRLGAAHGGRDDFAALYAERHHRHGAARVGLAAART